MYKYMHPYLPHVYQGTECGTLLLLFLMCAFCVIGYNEYGAEGLPTSMYQFGLSRS